MEELNEQEEAFGFAARVSQWVEKIRHLQNIADDAENEIAFLQDSCTEIVEQATTNYKEEIGECTSQIEKTLYDNIRLQIAIEDREKELDEMIPKTKELDQVKETLQQQNNQFNELNNEINSTKDNYSKNCIELEQCRSEEDELKQQITTAENRITNYKNIIHKLEDEIQNHNEMKSQRLSEMEEDYFKERKRLLSLKESSKPTTQSLVQTENNDTNDTTETRIKRDKFLERMNILKQEIQQSEYIIEEKTQRMKEIIEKKKIYADDIHDAEEKYVQLSSKATEEKKELEEKRKTLKETCERIKKEKMTLQIRYQNLLDDYSAGISLIRTVGRSPAKKRTRGPFTARQWLEGNQDRLLSNNAESSLNDESFNIKTERSELPYFSSQVQNVSVTRTA